MSVMTFDGDTSRRAQASTCAPERPATAPDAVALYREHRDRIYRYCYRRLGNAADAEDATQETFARAVVRLPGVTGEAALYLSAIARNVCYDASTARRRREVRETGLEGLDRPDLTAGPEETTADRCVLTRILAVLSRRERALLVQTYEGYSYEEIAKRMGLTVKVVSVGIVRARQHLRRIGSVGATAIGLGILVRRLTGWAARRVTSAAAQVRPDGVMAVEQAAFVAASLVVLAVAAAPAAGAASRTGVAQGPHTAPLGGPPAPVHRSLSLPTQSVQIRVTAPTPRATAAGAPVPPALPWLADDATEMTFTSFTPSPSYATDHTVFATGRVVSCTAQCGAVFVSRDGGDSWVRLSATLQYVDGPVLLPPGWRAGSSPLFTAASVGLERSDDGGRTFATVLPVPSAVAAPLGSAGGGALLVASSRVPAQTWLYDPVTGLSRPGPVLPAGRVAEDMVSLPDGSGVVVVTEPSTPGGSVAGGALGLARCTDSACVALGSVASASAVGPHVVVSASYAADHTVLLLAYDTLFMSNDGGATLHSVLHVTGNQLTAAVVGSLGALPPALLVAEQIYGGKAGSTVAMARSRDGGATFAPVATGAWTGVLSLPAMLLLPGGDVLASVASPATVGGGGVRCSTDAGTSWSPRC